MSDQLMTRDEIVRRLRLVTSQRVRHRPLTMRMIAARCGLSRVAVYDALHGVMGDQVRHLLSQVLREVPVHACDQSPHQTPSRRKPSHNQQRSMPPLARQARRGRTGIKRARHSAISLALTILKVSRLKQ